MFELFFSSPEISSEDTGHLCQSVLQDLSSVLSVDPASSNTSKPSLENGVASQENDGLEHDVTDDHDSVISSSLMVKLVVMAIATVTRLQSKGKVVFCLCCVKISNSLLMQTKVLEYLTLISTRVFLRFYTRFLSLGFR